MQTANAQTKARQAQAEAKATSTEQQEARRAETTVRELENEYQALVAETKVKVQEENQRRVVGAEEAQQSAKAKVAGLKAQILAEEQGVEMLKQKYEAEIGTPALAEKERKILESKAEVAGIKLRAQAEIDQLKKTLEIIEKGGKSGGQTYLIENFEKLITPFAETLRFFPVDNLSIITGAEGTHEPISAIHPNAVELEKNKFIKGAISRALKTRSTGIKESEVRRSTTEPERDSQSPDSEDKNDKNES